MSKEPVKKHRKEALKLSLIAAVILLGFEVFGLAWDKFFPGYFEQSVLDVSPYLVVSIVYAGFVILVYLLLTRFVKQKRK